MIKLKTSLIVLAGIFALAAAPSADAVATMTITVKKGTDNSVISTTTVSDTDGDGKFWAASDPAALKAGGYTITINASTKPETGGAAAPDMGMQVGLSFGGPSNASSNLSNINHYTAGNYVEITFTDDNFTTPVPYLESGFNGSSFPFGSIKYETFINGSLLASATQTSLTDTKDPVISHPVLLGSTYSLTQKLTLTGANYSATAGKSISVDAGLRTAVPDGGYTLTLLGGSLVCLGLVRRKVQFS